MLFELLLLGLYIQFSYQNATDCLLRYNDFLFHSSRFDNVPFYLHCILYNHFLTISYNFRRHYHLSVPRSFTELLATHSPEVVEGLRKSYSTVEDIELYIGGELFFY